MIKTSNKTIQASLLVALSAVLYGFLGYFGTVVISDNISISTMLFWRFLIAGVAMLPFICNKNTFQQLRQSDKRILLYMLIFGAIGYSVSSGAYFLAAQYTGTGLAMVIFFSYPIAVAVSSWIMHGKGFNFVTSLTLLVMVIGLVLIQHSAAVTFSWIGIGFSVLAALGYAFYVVGSKKISSPTLDPNLLTFIVCLSCAGTFLLMALYDNSFLVPQTPKSWMNLLALGIFATAIPIQLMLKGLKYISSMRASIISVIEPLMTVFVGILLLNESISQLQALGAVMILGGTLLVQFQKDL